MTCCSKSGLKSRSYVMVLLSLFVFGGCANPKLIPNTKVKDTPENRSILEVVETYRRAMENHNAAAVLALIHPTYMDNSGTPEGSDDKDYEGVKKLLATSFDSATKIRYRIEVQKLRSKGREAELDVYIDGTFVYEVPKALPRWRRLTDYHRFHLLKEGERWLFTSGL
jgi:hypothetical protein